MPEQTNEELIKQWEQILETLKTVETRYNVQIMNIKKDVKDIKAELLDRGISVEDLSE